MIHPHNNATANKWARNEFQVQLVLPGHSQPMGYCDGSDEDEQELRAQAEDEGVNEFTIHKKMLKGGRQIWTLGAPPVSSEEDW